MPEFIRVTFADPRDVFIDGQLSGRTQATLRVEKGTHTIHLGEPRNYTPNWRRPRVEKTSPIKPLEVSFDQI
ncbi:MAG TPA: hypothetical protein VGC93_17475 [Thermoanaerobaculia bacterium]